MPFKNVDRTSCFVQAFLRVIILVLLATPAKSVGEPIKLPIFPGAEGFGTETPAGRGGKIIKVKNLKNDGPGSLRVAIETAERRIIVFEVGGTIALTSDLNITSPYVTIAGQTAPSPGITLRGAGLRVTTHDVLVQHLRIRVGDAVEGPAPANRDALQILGPRARNVVIDHLSASWGVDENVSTWYPLENVTIRHSIISEGLAGSTINRSGQGGKGLLIGDASKKVAIIGNLLAHNIERNPRIKGDSSTLIVNNLFYNPGRYSFMSIGSSTGPVLVSAVGNIFMPGPETAPSSKAIKVEANATAGTRVYMHDNRYSGVIFSAQGPMQRTTDTPPLWCDPLTVLPSRSVQDWVLAHAGARPKDADAVDVRIKAEVKGRRGKIISSQEAVGGWPASKMSTRPFVLPINPSEDDDGDGYTNIEEILQKMANELENA